MQNELQGMYWRGQQLKAESLTHLEDVDVSNVTAAVPIAATGAMQISKEISTPEEGNKGSFFSAEPIFALPPRFKGSRDAARLKTKQSWEGTVITCEDNSFTARVIDRTNPANPAEAVVFEFDEISPDDRQLIIPGAAFYWTLGTETSPAGQIRNVNFVNFRRLPGWNRTSFLEAEERAKQVLSLFTEE